MKKSLLATVAAVALIAGAGFASAEGAKDQPATKGSAAAPVKNEPAMKQGADIKAGAKAETTGAGEKAEPKADVKAEGKTEGKTEMKAEPKSGADSKMKASEEKSAPAAKSAKDEKAAPASKSASEDKSGAAASKSQAQTKPDAKTDTKTEAKTDAKGDAKSVTLTTEQKTKIRTTVIQSSSAPKVSRSSINFNINVGTVVPRSVKFVRVSPTIVEYYPAYSSYSYFVVDDEIIIVEPDTLKIVAIINV